MNNIQAPPMLIVKHLNMTFGGLTALNDINLTVDKNSITALIGPNGAGKTTLFNCITGFYKATKGKLLLLDKQNNTYCQLDEMLAPSFFNKKSLNPKSLLASLYYKLLGGSHLIARTGIARTFQNIRLFGEMSVIENLLCAQHNQLSHNLIKGILNTKSFRQQESKALAHAYHWLECVGLQDDANKMANSLPYGHQRRLEIARAMCTQPTLLCLDEPAAGLNPSESKSVSQLIKKLKTKYKITVLLIEHDMNLVMNLADHIIVLDQGKIIATGLPAKIATHPEVLHAYLGIAHNV